jgi:NADH:ubiquinone oxidoreductase subunit 3 (subunit A)
VDTHTWLLLPPIALLFVFLFVWLQAVGFKLVAFRTGKPQANGTGKSYACGEDVKDPRVQPDYDQFFHFAFFFTVMHVVALVVATVPSGSLGAFALSIFYLVGAALGLFILFRR